MTSISPAAAPPPLHHSFEAAAAARAQYAPTVLRAALGAVFLAHAYAKAAVFTFPGTVAFFQAFGLPGWSVYPVFALELVGGLLLLLGLHVRLVSALLIPVMLGALIPHASNGWMFTNSGGGWEYVAVLLFALVAQLLLGPGKLALARSASYSSSSSSPNNTPTRRSTPSKGSARTSSPETAVSTIT